MSVARPPRFLPEKHFQRHGVDGVLPSHLASFKSLCLEGVREGGPGLQAGLFLRPPLGTRTLV